MDTPSSKRRKTASPIRPEYASYQSPTKASLARYNPRLLASRPRSTQGSPIRPKRTEDQRRITIDPALLKISEDQVTAKRVRSVEGTEDPADETASSSRRTEDSIKGPIAAAIDDEDLPETPQKLQGAAEFQDTPPRGILFHSTPRHRQQRENIAKNTTSGESPSTVELEVTAEADVENPRSIPLVEARLGPEEGQTTAVDTLELLDMKRRELSKLQDELQNLRKSLSSLDKHVDLINKTPETEQYVDIMGLISNAIEAQAKDHEKKCSSPELSIATLLTSFLPFSIPFTQAPQSEDDAPIPSHSPLPNKPELLGLFSPLEITSSTSPPSKPSNSKSPIIQLHTITLTSPNALLNAKLGLTISSSAEEANAPTVSNLNIQDLSLWAKHEIGPSIEAYAKTGDIGSVGYSLARYWEISLKRAYCWSKLCRQYPHLIRDIDHVASKDTKQKGKRKRGATRENYAQDEIRRHLGRSYLTFKDGHAELRISWAISLDWSGEIESRISSKTSFPMIWHEADDRSSLKTAPRVFDQLVERFGPTNATKVLVSLIFKDNVE